MAADKHSLPDDPEALKELPFEFGEQYQNVQEEKAAALADLDAKQKRINILEEQLRLMKQKRFGSTSEKAGQQSELFNEPELDAGETATSEEAEESAETETVTYQRKQRGGRKPLSADLPRVRVEHDLLESEKVCAC